MRTFERLQRIAGLWLALGVCGCGSTLVPVRLDVPAGARLTVARGVNTPEVTVQLPFVAKIEGNAGGTPLPISLELDDATARRYGGKGALRLEAQLAVRHRDFVSQPVRVLLSDDLVGALVRGEVPELVAHSAEATSEGKPLASLTIRGPR